LFILKSDNRALCWNFGLTNIICNGITNVKVYFSTHASDQKKTHKIAATITRQIIKPAVITRYISEESLAAMQWEDEQGYFVKESRKL